MSGTATGSIRLASTRRHSPWRQAIGIAAAGAWAALVTYVLLKILDALVGLRVAVDDEREGLDTALHGESAYGNAGAVHEA